MTNQQTIEPVNFLPQDLEVHSIFYTLQGEGPFTGVPSVFIRLAGCNLQCPACDTDYTGQRVFMNVDTIVNHVRDRHRQPKRNHDPAPNGLVVITGGEPFRQNVTPLLKALVKAGFYVQIETNGTLRRPEIQYSQSPSMRYGVYLVASPKTPKVYPGLFHDACCVKYVLSIDSVLHEDGLPYTVLGHLPGGAKPVARPPADFRKPIYLQPADTGDAKANTANEEAVKQSCLIHGYTFQLQIHKLLGLE